MKQIFLALAGCITLAASALVVLLFVIPRPPDTTEASVYGGDAAKLDHCNLPILDGRGRSADQIPKAYTSGCGWTQFPMPVLADCGEPLAEEVVDMRGLWLAYTGLIGHVERIEQCGGRTVVSSEGVIHDFHTDGTLANGSRDIEPPLCLNTFVSIEFDEGVMKFSPFGLPFTIVTRRMDGDELVWTYPGVEGEIRMKRICELPLKVFSREHH